MRESEMQENKIGDEFAKQRAEASVDFIIRKLKNLLPPEKIISAPRDNIKTIPVTSFYKNYNDDIKVDNNLKFVHKESNIEILFSPAENETEFDNFFMSSCYSDSTSIFESISGIELFQSSVLNLILEITKTNKCSQKRLPPSVQKVVFGDMVIYSSEEKSPDPERPFLTRKIYFYLPYKVK